MKTLSQLVQAIITRLPEVETVTELNLIERDGLAYVYFTYRGSKLRLDYSMNVEEVDGNMLCTSNYARNIQAVLRGMRDSLDNKNEKDRVVNDIVDNASFIELQELLIGIGEPEEGSLEELQKAVRDWLHGENKDLTDKTEVIWLFFGHEKGNAYNGAFRK